MSFFKALRTVKFIQGGERTTSDPLGSVITLWRAFFSALVQLAYHTHKQYVSTLSIEQWEKETRSFCDRWFFLKSLRK